MILYFSKFTIVIILLLLYFTKLNFKHDNVMFTMSSNAVESSRPFVFSMISAPQIASIVHYNKTSVRVFWKAAGWETTLPLDGSLFEPISEEGRSKRNCI